MKISAGILLYRNNNNNLEVLLVHPGGPLWTKKDVGAWTIPKGEINEEEDYLLAAQREFKEELGYNAPEGNYVSLGYIIQKGGKKVYAWGHEGNLDPQNIKSNMFSMEWPPRSGTQQQFKEIDKVAFFNIETAYEKINPAQKTLIEKLVTLIT